MMSERCKSSEDTLDGVPQTTENDFLLQCIYKIFDKFLQKPQSSSENAQYHVHYHVYNVVHHHHNFHQNGSYIEEHLIPTI